MTGIASLTAVRLAKASKVRCPYKIPDGTRFQQGAITFWAGAATRNIESSKEGVGKWSGKKKRRSMKQPAHPCPLQVWCRRVSKTPRSTTSNDHAGRQAPSITNHSRLCVPQPFLPMELRASSGLLSTTLDSKSQQVTHLRRNVGCIRSSHVHRKKRQTPKSHSATSSPGEKNHRNATLTKVSSPLAIEFASLKLSPNTCLRCASNTVVCPTGRLQSSVL